MRICCRSRTSQPKPGHRVFPYLMRGLSIERPHQVWCADTTYIPLQRGFLYLSVAVPHYVAPEEIEALIASCDASTVISGQDRAVLPLLARLSLRPGDLTAVRLAGIDWEQALLTVSGKERRREALPLPQDVGDALKDYLLRARPRTADTTVILRSPAPTPARPAQRLDPPCDGRCDGPVSTAKASRPHTFSSKTPTLLPA